MILKVFSTSVVEQHWMPKRVINLRMMLACESVFATGLKVQCVKCFRKPSVEGQLLNRVFGVQGQSQAAALKTRRRRKRAAN